MHHFFSIKRVLPATLLLFACGGQAATFECTIRGVLKLSDNGSMAAHGWSANYMNRRFTLDGGTGKVTGTTALKVRLSNYNRDNQPMVLDEAPYKSITLFRDAGRYAVIEIETGSEGSQKPFFYRTNIGMFLTGLCTVSSD